MQTRRLFLKSIFSLPLFLIFNQKSTAKQIAKHSSKTILLNQCSIAGFQYYQGKDVLHSLKINDSIVIVAESDNQYDKYAVAVYYQTKKLGYIPRKENKHVSRILQAGVKLHARVNAVDVNQSAWNAVEVAVYMQV